MGTLASEGFVNDGATGSGSFPTSGATPTTSASQIGAAIRYDAATQGYTLSVNGRSQSFLPANLDAGLSSATLAVYAKTNGATTDTLTLTKSGTSGRFTYQYVGAAFWQRTIQGSSAISGSFDAVTYGVATPDAATPRSGVARYAVDLVGAVTDTAIQGFTGDGMAEIDFASGAVVTHGNITGDGLGGTFSGQGNLSSSANRFTGVFRYNSIYLYNGTMEGRLYGPGAQELGASFTATGTGARVIVGSLIGRGGAVSASNSTVTSLTADEFFTNDSALLTTTLPGATGMNGGGEQFSNTSAGASPLAVHYDAGSKAFSLIAPDRSRYLNGEHNPGPSETLSTTTPSNNLQGYPYATFTNLRYVASQEWRLGGVGNPQYRIQEFTYGIETPDGALPRSGSATYAIGFSGKAADADYSNFTKITGFGALTADFGLNKLTADGQMIFTEDWEIAGRAPGQKGGRFTASADISSNANSFSGPISFDGLGSYSGMFNGRFYGPSAQEVGAAFTATDGAGGRAVGTFTGGRDSSVATPIQTLTGLSGATDLKHLANDIQAARSSLNQMTKVAYDPAVQGYTLSFQNIYSSGSATYTLSLGAGNRDGGASTASWERYTGQINGIDYVASLLKPGASNPTLALTYTTFAAITAPLAGYYDPRAGKYFVAFGLATPQQRMPLSGSGTYTGLLLGAGRTRTNAFNGGPSVTTDYDVTGTVSMTANFTSKGGDISAAVDLTGKDVNSAATIHFAPLTLSGSISGTSFSARSGDGGIGGTFFGPNAEEVGGSFSYSTLDPSSTETRLNGGFVGKR